MSLRTIEGHADGDMAVAFSRYGKSLASAEDGTIKLLDPIVGGLQDSIGSSGGVRDCSSELAFSPTGELLASAGDCTIRLRDAVIRSLQCALQIISRIKATVFLPTCQLVSSDQNHTIQL